MVQVSLDSLLVVKPEELSSQEKDDLYESVLWLEVPSQDMSSDQYQSLFLITKELMKYKGEQVESLLADLDILASNTGRGSEEIEEELSKANKKIEQLIDEIQAKDKDLEGERLQIEKLLSEISELQKEKAELRKEMVMIQSEIQTRPSENSVDDSIHDTEELKEMVQHKNQHILQLLSDIQILEKENELLNNKINGMRQELSEATTSLTKLTGENISLRQSNQEFKEKIDLLDERNSGLMSQVSDLVEERNKREAHLDLLIDALEERVTKWQEILSEKDEEVSELRSKLNESIERSAPKGSMVFTANYLELTKTIEEQEEAIRRLHDQLKQATEDMSHCSVQVQELKQKAESKGICENDIKTLEEMKEELDKAYSKISYLEEKASDAEQDAQFRAEEMTELIIQLKEYEEGVYGLCEARNQVKELKRQLKIRDSQILSLVEQMNRLTLQAGDREQISLENLDKYFDDEGKTSSLDLQTQLSAIQQTAINLSMQNFELRAEIVKLNEDLKKKEGKIPDSRDGNEKVEMEEKLKFAIEENESLRKGLHEILESIQGHDGSSSVVIESECLERLLEALDARHVSGWYHPAMRIQAALNKMQGSNEALRQELRDARFRESYFQAELQNTMIQVGELQDQLRRCYEPEHPVPVPAPRKKLIIQDESKSKANGDDPENNDDDDNKPTNQLAEKEIQKSDSKEECRKVESDFNDATIEIKLSSIGEHTDTVTQTDLEGITSTQDAQLQTDLLMHHIDHVQLNKDLNIDKTNDLTVTEKFVIESDENSNKVPQKLAEESKSDDPLDSSEKAVSSDSVNDGSPVANSSKLNLKLKQLENELKNKCDDLKTEFENIKIVNELALAELHKNKQELFSEVEKALIKVTEEMKMMKEAEISKSSGNEFALGAFQEQEAKLLSYGIELGELRKGLSEKDNYIKFLETKITDLNTKMKESNTQRQEQEEKRLRSLKETINGLEDIISQKEETCQRYKALLHESNEEYGQLLEKYNQLERSSHVFPTPRDHIGESRSVSILMEKWISRVGKLESEIDELNNNLMEVTNDLEASRKETSHWKILAESLREKTIYEEDQEAKTKKEMEELRSQLKKLKEETELALQTKIKNELSKMKEKEDHLKEQIKCLENENNRLKHQLNLRSTKSSTKSVKKEIILMEKIKCLEDEIEKSREREQSQLQMRRDKCADEVAKWEEKKRLQAANEKYRHEVKEKSNHIEVLEGQISRLKVIIARMERERISLQRKLKIQDGLLAKSMSEEDKPHESDDNKSYLTDSRFETAGLDSTPRSPAESIHSELHDPKIKTQSRRDLVRAIAALKKVINRLRAEHSNYYHKDYVEQLQNELHKMENNYMDAVERTLMLEEQIRESEAKLCGQTYIVPKGEDRSEIMLLKEQLAQKCELLCKVKVLLQRALLREKQLIHQPEDGELESPKRIANRKA